MDINKDIKNATKWSAYAELLAKLINPITSMVLARLLTPEAFGIVTTVTMIIVFAEIFTDAGFQKYLIQHDFDDQSVFKDNINVAFWTNLFLSLCIWGIIVLFDENIARLVGNPGLGYVISIASFSIPLEAFSSIQMALYKREFDFRTLFKTRLVSILVPLIITIPLAYIIRNFWAIICGTICSNLINAIVLTVYSKWKPTIFYSWKILKEMFSFSFWSLIEALSIWFTNYIDVFIVGIVLSQYYLGLYKTSITLVGQITAIVTSITTPVLFSALSRLQTDRVAFESMFFKFQKMVGMLIIPLGVGIYCFRDFITIILLGDKWMEASFFIGVWGLSSSLTVVLAHFSSEVYRSLGKPSLSVLAQWLHIVVLIPVLLFFVHGSFELLCTARASVRIELVIVQMVIMHYCIKLSIFKMIITIIPSLLCSIIMFVVSLILCNISHELLWTIFSICICVLTYFASLLLFKNERMIIYSTYSNIQNKLKSIIGCKFD